MGFLLLNILWCLKNLPFRNKVDNASFSHNSDRFQAPILKDLNLKIGRSDFVGIVGGVGAGKSSLLLGMLGELEKTDGIISMNDNHDGIAIVTQDPWIFNGTIRENILFGSFYNPEWYRQVIESCALLGK
jgi:ABC-type multidrug transport system fused ATPase/permease subunit